MAARPSPDRIARAARRELQALARPLGDFDASRYFRGADTLRFFNVGTPAVRALARRIVGEHGDWSVDDANSFAALLIADPVLEAKGLAVEVVARYRRSFRRQLFGVWKGWLVAGHASNWATTDGICGSLLGPLLVMYPELAPKLRSWSRCATNPWVRRASTVALLPSIRRGQALDLAYEFAERLHPDPNDLIHKAVGWMLREAGKVDAARLARYLRAHGREMPRTTVRYAIERFPASARRDLLIATRPITS